MDQKEHCTGTEVSSSGGYQQYDSDSQKVVKSKNPRRRKRAFYNTIRSQMEFYFGDANLSKDRFLMQLIKEDPFVPLDVFLKFNKIKKLVSSVEDIANAVAYSELLKLNEDKTKVRRVTELPENWNADDRTIYVESLPPTADHDWVKNVFSRFGAVSYVSLPKFKISRKIKEFGFVEFEKHESVVKALNALTDLGNVICAETDDPEKLMSITSYIKEQKEIDEGVKDSDDEEKGEKHSHSVESDNSSAEQPAAKRRKISTSAQPQGEERTDDCSESDTKPKATDDESPGIQKKKKKRRKLRKKSQNKASDLEFDMSELRILSKIDWKRLRNKYLNMQRKRMGEIKRELRKKQTRTPATSKSGKIDVVVVKKPATQQSMNFYGAGGQQERSNENDPPYPADTGERNTALERQPLFKYEPNLILRMKLLEPCVNIKSFKADMKQYPGVKYVDVKEGASEAFVRCETAKHTKNLKKKVSCAEYTCEILTGDPEHDYWNKIMRDREMKLNKEVKVPQKRGREKLSKAVATHVFFKDDEYE